MAEGFARAYGSDVMTASSAGLYPTSSVAAETIETMFEKNIDISSHVPKQFDPAHTDADIILNMAGSDLPGDLSADVRRWDIEDPYGRSLNVYRRSCQEIENRVMHLILELRKTATVRH